MAVIALAACIACSKEEQKSREARQETNIANFISSVKSQVDTAYNVNNKGANRVVVVYGDGDSLAVDGTVSFYYAGYVLTGSSVNASSMFATNSKEVAKEAEWEVSDSTVFDIKTLKLNDAGLVKGLEYGLKGVRAGQESYILFSDALGFGKKALGTIPANSALVYHVWVESISNE